VNSPAGTAAPFVTGTAGGVPTTVVGKTGGEDEGQTDKLLGPR